MALIADRPLNHQSNDPPSTKISHMLVQDITEVYDNHFSIIGIKMFIASSVC